jgi:molybdate transport system substrate-binding protein
LEELGSKFEKETGNKLNITWGLISAFTKRAQEGDVPDVLVVSRASIDSLTKDGKIATGSDATLAKSVFAIAVKRGTPKPDISSAESLKSALLAARAVGYSDPAAGGASGVHFRKSARAFGDRRRHQSQEQISSAGRFRRDAIGQRRGRHSRLQSKPELSSIEGVEIVSPLPGDLGSTTVFAAAVGASSPNSETGKALVSS